MTASLRSQAQSCRALSHAARYIGEPKDKNVWCKREVRSRLNYLLGFEPKKCLEAKGLSVSGFHCFQLVDGSSYHILEIMALCTGDGLQMLRPIFEAAFAAAHPRVTFHAGCVHAGASSPVRHRVCVRACAIGVRVHVHF